MLNRDLIDAILQEYQGNSTKTQMRENLLAQGWTEEDIKEGIRRVQTMALEQIPGVGFIIKYFSNLEQRMIALSPRSAVIILLAIAFAVFALAASFSWGISWGEKGEAQRDSQRTADKQQIMAGINSYYRDKRQYPDELVELTPLYLPGIPVDPKTKAPYQYVNKGSYYTLCFKFELQPLDCDIPLTSTVIEIVPSAQQYAPPSSAISITPTTR